MRRATCRAPGHRATETVPEDSCAAEFAERSTMCAMALESAWSADAVRIATRESCDRPSIVRFLEASRSPEALAMSACLEVRTPPGELDGVREAAAPSGAGTESPNSRDLRGPQAAPPRADGGGEVAPEVPVVFNPRSTRKSQVRDEAVEAVRIRLQQLGLLPSAREACVIRSLEIAQAIVSGSVRAESGARRIWELGRSLVPDEPGTVNWWDVFGGLEEELYRGIDDYAPESAAAMRGDIRRFTLRFIEAHADGARPDYDGIYE